MTKIHNFSAGPAVLPQSALEAGADAIKNFANTGLSILEVSHRGKEFEAVMEDSRQTIKRVLGVPDGYSILFLQGGASLQFAMVPYNLLNENETAAYTNTGVWASKAIKEAKLFGNVNVVASSEEKNFSYIPKDFVIPSDAVYFHCTSNNTIYGTEMHSFPGSPVPMVCDMSSDIFSRPVDVSKFGLIYAGAQKNLGPAGMTLVIVKDSLLGRVTRKIPSMLDYRVHIKDGSMFNTPPVFAIYVALHTLKWIEHSGGLKEMDARNQAKADLLYNEIDRNPLFKGTCAIEDRSRMNVCFLLADSTLEDEFMKLAKLRNISGIKGHRSVGGFRASLYNALEIESVKALVDCMQEFEKLKSGSAA